MPKKIQEVTPAVKPEPVEKATDAAVRKKPAAKATAKKAADKKPAVSSAAKKPQQPKSAAKSAEKPIKKPTEKPAEKAVSDPTEKAVKKPATKTAKKAVEKPAEKPVEKVIKKVEEKAVETTVENPAEKPVEVKAEPEPVAAQEQKPAKKAVAEKPAAPVIQAAKPKKKAEVKASGKRKILFVGSEAAPFAGTGGLGEVLGSLPRAINASGEYEARVILPLYDGFPQSRRKDLEFVCWTFVTLSWRNQYCGLFKLKDGNTTFYFVDNEYYFKRKNLYGYDDDGERFAFFSRAVIELLPRLDFMPDVLHCNDWQTALVPIYYKLFYMYRDGFGGIKTVYTIHNIEYQGWFGRNMLGDVFGIPDHEFMSIEHFGQINLMKGAIDYSDAVNTVSPTYAEEIMTAEYAHSLDGDLCRNRHKLRGILNGIDVDTYDPQTNPALFAHYSADDISGKAINKAGLQKLLWLPIDKNVPIIAMITRLASHKGLDIVREAMPAILSRNVQFIILGTGDGEYERYFTWLQDEYDGKMRAVIAFDRELSHRIYAGADMFLMPSKAEPCGLSQMMACRYGTIPIVRETGGLRDSIVDAYNGDFGNGYRFSRYAADDLIRAIDRATGLYNDYRDKWNGLVDRAMRTDFSWAVSAKEYIKFYNEILG